MSEKKPDPKKKKKKKDSGESFNISRGYKADQFDFADPSGFSVQERENEPRYTDGVFREKIDPAADLAYRNVKTHGKTHLVTKAEASAIIQFFQDFVAKNGEATPEDILNALRTWSLTIEFSKRHRATTDFVITVFNDVLQNNPVYQATFGIPSDLEISKKLLNDNAIRLTTRLKEASKNELRSRRDVLNALGMSSGNLAANSLKPISLYIDPGEADAKDITELFHALNDFYRHMGGDSNLKFINEGCKTAVGEFA